MARRALAALRATFFLFVAATTAAPGEALALDAREILRVRTDPAVAYPGDPIVVTAELRTASFDFTPDVLRVDVCASEACATVVDSEESDFTPDVGDSGVVRTTATIFVDPYVHHGGDPIGFGYLKVYVEDEHLLLDEERYVGQHLVVFRLAAPPESTNGVLYDEYAEMAFVRYASLWKIRNELIAIHRDESVFPWNRALEFVATVVDRIYEISSFCSSLDGALSPSANFIQTILRARSAAESLESIFDLEGIRSALDSFMSGVSWESFQVVVRDRYVEPVLFSGFMAGTDQAPDRNGSDDDHDGVVDEFDEQAGIVGLLLEEERSWLGLLSGEDRLRDILDLLAREEALRAGIEEELASLASACVCCGRPDEYVMPITCTGMGPEDFAHAIRYCNDGTPISQLLRPDGFIDTFDDEELYGYANGIATRIRESISQEAIESTVAFVERECLARTGDANCDGGEPCFPACGPGFECIAGACLCVGCTTGSVDHVALSLSPDVLPLDSGSVSQIAVWVTGPDGYGVGSVPVELRADRAGAVFSPEAPITDGEGLARATFRSTALGETGIWAVADGVASERRTATTVGADDAYRISLNYGLESVNATSARYWIRAFVTYGVTGETVYDTDITLETSAGTFAGGQTTVTSRLEDGELYEIAVYVLVTSSGPVTVTGRVAGSIGQVSFQARVGEPEQVDAGVTFAGSPLRGDDQDHEMAFSPDGQLLAYGTSSGGTVVDTRTWKAIGGVAGGGNVVALDFSRDGTYLAAAHNQDHAYIYRTSGLQEICNLQSIVDNEKPHGIAWSQDVDRVAVLTEDGDVNRAYIFNTNCQRLRTTEAVTLPYGTLVALDWCGDRIAVGDSSAGEARVIYWDPDTGSVSGSTRVSAIRMIYSLQWSSDCQELAVSGDSNNSTGVVIVNRSGGIVGTVATDVGKDIETVGWAPERDRLVIAHSGGTKVIDRSGNDLVLLNDGGRDSVAWSPSGVIAVLGGGARVYAPFDVSPPSVTAAADAWEVSTDTSHVGVHGTAADVSGLLDVAYQVNGDELVPVEFDADGDFEFDAMLAHGANNIVVLATDLAGHVGRRALSVFRRLPCEAVCGAATCGPDGCGGLCPPGCDQDEVCFSGSCVPLCMPDCAGKDCGADGCGGECGQCGADERCVEGLCQCAPNCADRECGDDGCGGACGACPEHHVCEAGSCVCAPDCLNRECGDDGCGGICGSCDDDDVCTSDTCVAGACTYTAEVECPDGEACDPSSGECVAVCLPQCDGRQCGADGCGGTCGTCETDQQCFVGECVSGCVGVPLLGCCDGTTAWWCDTREDRLHQNECQYCGWSGPGLGYSCLSEPGGPDPQGTFPLHCAGYLACATTSCPAWQTCDPSTGGCVDGANAICAEMPPEGCCAHGAVVWCKDGVRQELECTPSPPLVCGWNAGLGAFACVETPGTPPGGVLAACPGACVADADCDDGLLCTADTCEAGRCTNSPLADCCESNGDCDDQNACTVDRCIESACRNDFSPTEGCCAGNGDCDDQDPCTTDRCIGGDCQNAPLAGCCSDDADCDDQDPCTIDRCLPDGACQHSSVEDCCAGNGDCDDDNACTTDRCSDRECRNDFYPTPGCCQGDDDCDDRIGCTVDRCVDSACWNEYSPTPGCCEVNTDCGDGNACTADRCVDAACRNDFSPTDGCCVDDSGCDDGDSCTVDRCVAGNCVSERAPGCVPQDAGGTERDGGPAGPGTSPSDAADSESASDSTAPHDGAAGVPDVPAPGAAADGGGCSGAGGRPSWFPVLLLLALVMVPPSRGRRRRRGSG